MINRTDLRWRGPQFSLSKIVIFSLGKAKSVLKPICPPGCDVSPSQGYPLAFHQTSLTIWRHPFIQYSKAQGEQSVLPRNTTLRPDQVLNPDPLAWSPVHRSLGRGAFHIVSLAKDFIVTVLLANQEYKQVPALAKVRLDWSSIPFRRRKKKMQKRVLELNGSVLCPTKC